MMFSNAVVLLSGGLDSTAALFWALHRYERVRALAVDYGQPNRDQELFCARAVTDALGVPFSRVAVADALRPAEPIGLLRADGGVAGGPFHRAFVPGRNIVFASIAAAHACSWWSDRFDIVVGTCVEDHEGFPDCRPSVLDGMARVLSFAIGRETRIMAPWAASTKRQILYAIAPDEPAFAYVKKSWSCYRDDGPCGECNACTKRAQAFADLGIVDECRRAKLKSADPHRAR